MSSSTWAAVSGVNSRTSPADVQHLGIREVAAEKFQQVKLNLG